MHGQSLGQRSSTSVHGAP